MARVPGNELPGYDHCPYETQRPGLADSASRLNSHQCFAPKSQNETLATHLNLY